MQTDPRTYLNDIVDSTAAFGSSRWLRRYR
jgi:hypothetical protein